MASNKTILGYTDDDISKVINKFWNKLISDLNNVDDPDVYQGFLKFVINFKSSEELIDMLTAMNSVSIFIRICTTSFQLQFNSITISLRKMLITET